MTVVSKINPPCIARGVARRQRLPARMLAIAKKQAERCAQRGSVWAPALAKRWVDLTLATILGVVTLPLLIALAIVARMLTGKAFRWSLMAGRMGKPFYRCRLSLSTDPQQEDVLRSFASLPTIWHVVRGDMSWVGPRPLPIHARRPVDFVRRSEDRPGVVCLWWIRQRANIDYDSEFQADREYTESRSTLSDWGMAIRAVWVGILNRTQRTSAPRNCGTRLNVLGVPVRNVSMSQAVKELSTALEADGPPVQATFVNADCVNLAQSHADYHSCLRAADWNYPDGIGMKLAAQWQNSALCQNVNGTDLFPRLLEQMEDARLGVYLFGGEPGVADEVAAWIGNAHPGVVVCGAKHGFIPESSHEKLVHDINQSGADLLLVAMGAPRQELWISHWLPSLNVRVAMGVGGLFDFYSGRRRRAPPWIRELGMEWAFRWWLEPRRLCRRYLIGNVLFMWRVLTHSKVRTKR